MSFHYVYILRSVPQPDQTYVGLTEDLKARLIKHNQGGTGHTRRVCRQNGLPFLDQRIWLTWPYAP